MIFGNALGLFKGASRRRKARRRHVQKTDAPSTSVGRPLPGVHIRLVDEAGNDVPVGDEGEIWAKGANIFPGYHNDIDATRAALTDDGWLLTGDMGVVQRTSSTSRDSMCSRARSKTCCDRTQQLLPRPSSALPIQLAAKPSRPSSFLSTAT